MGCSQGVMGTGRIFTRKPSANTNNNNKIMPAQRLPRESASKPAVEGSRSVRPKPNVIGTGTLTTKDKEAKESPFEAPLDEFRDQEQEYLGLSRATHFDVGTVRELHDIFVEISGSRVNDDLIDMEEFAHALGLSPHSMLVKMLFRSFDVTRDQMVNFREFVMALSSLSPKAPQDEKIRFTFNLFDLNKDGVISLDELQKMMESVANEDSGLVLTKEQIKQVCDHTFTQMDLDKNGFIDFQEYRNMVLGKPWFLTPFSVDVVGLIGRRNIKRMSSRSVMKQKLEKKPLNDTENDSGGKFKGDTKTQRGGTITEDVGTVHNITDTYQDMDILASDDDEAGDVFG